MALLRFFLNVVYYFSGLGCLEVVRYLRGGVEGGDFVFVVRAYCSLFVGSSRLLGLLRRDFVRFLRVFFRFFGEDE